MAGQIIDNTWIPEIPIIQGVDWGGSIGHKWTADVDISTVVFTLTLKRGTETILAMTETDGHISHSGTYDIYIKIPKATTSLLSKGAVKGDLIGTTAGVSTIYGSISTFIR